MYLITVDQQIVCESPWPVAAEAAWRIHSRGRGEPIELRLHGKVIAKGISSDTGLPWPEEACTTSATAKAVANLIRALGYNRKDVVGMLADQGVVLSSSKVDNLLNPSRRRYEPSPAELALLLDAVCFHYRGGDSSDPEE